MFIRISMSMNESSSKLRIKVYYFLFGSLLFLLIYTIIFYTHPLPEPSIHPPYSHKPVFQKPSSDCLRIVASLQFEFLRDLHKSFRPHNSTEIAVYSVSLVVYIFQVIICIYTIEKYIIYLRTKGRPSKRNESNREETKYLVTGKILRQIGEQSSKNFK